MREQGIEYKVGLLVVGAIVLFAGFVFILGNFSFAESFTLYVDYEFSGNVQPGAPVKISGIEVGRVESVDFHGGQIDERTGRRVQVRVELRVEDRARESVRRDAEFFINTAGVLGEQYIEIVPGRDWESPPLAPGSIVHGVDPPRTDLVVARLYEVLDTVSVVLREDRDKIRTMIENASSAIAQVDKILSENDEHIGELLVSANDLARETKVTLSKVNAGLTPEMVASTLRHADSLIANADQAVVTLTPTANTFLASATRVTDQITPERVERTVTAIDRASSVAHKAGALLDNANGMLTDIRAGKGTAGKLLAKDELYADIRELVRDLRRNPWKVFWKE